MEVLLQGGFAIHSHGYSGVLERGHQHLIQSSNLERDELLCFHPLLLYSLHSSSPPFCLYLSFGSDMCGYNGIKYSSTTLASAFSNLTPAFTFILAVVFRMENLYFRRSSTQAKIIGTVISISGAFVAVLYKGPTLISSSKSNELHQGPLALGTTQTNWVIGGLLFASQYLLLSSWYIVQTQVMKIYPAELIVVFLFILCTTIIAVPVCLIAETNPSAWRLRLDISLVTIIFAGFFGPSFSSVVHTWGLHLKGPVYVSIFKPFSVVIAAAMGVVFLGDSLHLGSVLGAIMLSLGFYGLIWGKAKEEETAREDSYPNLGNTPLLHRHEV
ncbi:WAT1-related protein At5g40240-like isoform X4 [Ziziphus jujuba]|uniref:WAT1-related protein At5g40240-like isoform X4 n=1 Tax=Ziziphus jujuba TaxID=326968 RepID=A0A6P4A005_ZIZJJ|nr:WAT1-related protein At5g40240-like isoform X4 [Ziziphus jujuba]